MTKKINEHMMYQLDKESTAIGDSFVEIVRHEISKIIGDCDYIEVSQRIMSNTNLQISVYIRHIGFTSFNFNGKHLIVKYNRNMDVLVKDINSITDIINQVLSFDIESTILDLYKRNYLDTLPSKIEKVSTIDLSLITKDWLVENFKDISEDIMNGESIENLDYNFNDNGLIINFDVDCGRAGLHRGCSLEINNRGNIKVDLDETPLDGCGIENELEDRIREIIEKPQ